MLFRNVHVELQKPDRHIQPILKYLKTGQKSKPEPEQARAPAVPRTLQRFFQNVAGLPENYVAKHSIIPQRHLSSAKAFSGSQFMNFSNGLEKEKVTLCFYHTF